MTKHSRLQMMIHMLEYSSIFKKYSAKTEKSTFSHKCAFILLAPHSPTGMTQTISQEHKTRDLLHFKRIFLGEKHIIYFLQQKQATPNF